ncbi:site-specific DNA-methyltransferase (cytosine-N(4)-specific) [Vibrio crassostreae]|nr:site-specific DNA-methyltransferase (cytosine-N(4)-specific) [Vibrio crassostreae]CAK1816140.1 site-specific DNA-methyltransferase (cytosine-N(4)-specific) [Vibrio crassostreae]CAK2428223.1 site-specific DNA-methyltransferase (cytosine-N(4)-specific) [Vibrio crassostreae]CAK2702307.1 site-specific DNA-methyltransferase (cytosine-N(4)-specific) [Vibrio crassostreae]CAK2755695.1 site-specific DNA-methyltransferase (cytosine-N(4)-specific) [Vibrio crassostreae]
MHISQDVLDIKYKTRNNLFKWSGQFSPQLIEALLDAYSESDYKVLDPFSGSGTVLYECARKGISALGVDVNPAANRISKAYELCRLSVKTRKKLAKQFKCVSNVDNVSDGYDLLLSINSDCKYINIIRDSLVVLLDSVTDIDKFHKVVDGFISVLLSMPYSNRHVNAINSDCRKIPVRANSIDLVITSPPYVNVFNYHQQYRKNTELLGHDILKIAKSEIGSNRKNRPNRFKTLAQYCKDISMSLNELIRVSKHESRLIFIVGKYSTIKKAKVYNGEIVKNLGLSMGLELVLDQTRTFKNRFGQDIVEEIIHFKNMKNTVVSESDLECISNEVATESLLKTLSTISDDRVADEIQAAISAVSSTSSSPLYM